MKTITLSAVTDESLIALFVPRIYHRINKVLKHSSYLITVEYDDNISHPQAEVLSIGSIENTSKYDPYAMIGDTLWRVLSKEIATAIEFFAKATRERKIGLAVATNEDSTEDAF